LIWLHSHVVKKHIKLIISPTPPFAQLREEQTGKWERTMKSVELWLLCWSMLTVPPFRGNSEHLLCLWRNLRLCLDVLDKSWWNAHCSPLSGEQWAFVVSTMLTQGLGLDVLDKSWTNAHCSPLSGDQWAFVVSVTKQTTTDDSELVWNVRNCYAVEMKLWMITDKTHP
jgi:hypothetical protein